MTGSDVVSTGPSGRRITWALDHDQSLLIITGRGGMTDDDLLIHIPTIWEQYPEVIGYDTLVDARRHNHAGGWTWGAMRELNRRWTAFARGPDRGRSTAIVTRDRWFAKLTPLFSVLYRQRRTRCFADLDDALTWLGRRRPFGETAAGDGSSAPVGASAGAPVGQIDGAPGS